MMNFLSTLGYVLAILLAACFFVKLWTRQNAAMERIRNMEARVFENDDVNILRLTPRDTEMILNLLSKPPMRPTAALLRAARDYNENRAAQKDRGTD